jgi:hypothetical protein
VVPAPLAGRGEELDVARARHDHGVWVIAVRSEGARVPWRDSHTSGPVRAGDQWLAIGPADALARLAAGER